MRRTLFALLLLCALATALQPEPTSPPQNPSAVLSQQVDLARMMIIPLMMALTVLAAVVYGIGHIFGGDVQARATTWAKSMLMAVVVAAVLVAVLFFFLPGYQPPVERPDYVEATVKDLADATRSILEALIFLLIVFAALVYVVGQLSGAETRARATVWATGILAGALVASVIYVVLFQVISQLGTGLFRGVPYMETYGPTIVLVGFFVSAIILITYLISRVFGVPEWEAYLSIELTNLVGSFLILVFVLGLFAGGEIFSAMLVQQGTATGAALKFLRESAVDSVMRAMYDIFRIQTCTSMLNTFSRRIGEAVLTNVFKVFPGIDTFGSIANVVGYGLVAIYGSLSAQVTFLNIVDATMVPFILPAGLILRFFPPTRDAGSFLIAFAFGLQFVFPLTFMVNSIILSDIGAPLYDSVRSEAIVQSICGPLKFGAMGFVFNPASNIPIIRNFPGFQMVFKTLLSEPVLNLFPMLEFVPVMRSVALLSLFALFIPAFALVITIASINAMTKFLTTKV